MRTISSPKQGSGCVLTEAKAPGLSRATGCHAGFDLCTAGLMVWEVRRQCEDSNRFLPTFSPPAATIDCIDVSSASSAEADLFGSLEGIVNRAQPRIACVYSS